MNYLSKLRLTSAQLILMNTGDMSFFRHCVVACDKYNFKMFYEDWSCDSDAACILVLHDAFFYLFIKY